ncbi:MAG: signal peptidase I, partial [Tepidiformaceae bacterium]
MPAAEIAAPSGAVERDGFLDEIFPGRAETYERAQPSDSGESQGGIFGRLFGRKKQHDADAPAAEKPEAARDTGRREAEEPAAIAKEFESPEFLEERGPEENPWRWPTEEPAAAVEEPALSFGAAAPVEPEEPASEENPWRWPAEEPAAAVEEPALSFGAAAPVVPEEPASEENPWRWPAEEPAAAVEEPALSFGAAAPVVPEEPASEENAWRWPAQEPAVQESSTASNSFDAAAVHFNPVSDDDGWDPEPYDASVSPRPEPTAPPVAVATEESEEGFTFSFEREESDPVVAATLWEAPVSLVAPTTTEEERPWWEADDEEVASPPTAGTGAESVIAAHSANPLPPTLAPTPDDDPWAQVASAEGDPEPEQVFEQHESAESVESAPGPQEALTGAWMAASEHEPEQTASDPSKSSGQAQNYFALAAESTEESESELDLAASLESQMEIAERELLLGGAWDEASGHGVEPSDGQASPAFDEDDDVVLRAFNAHAATPELAPPAPLDREVQRAQDAAFGEILGEGAADIVAEAADEDDSERSFLNPTPWVARRRDAPENPFDAPWEVDDGQPTGYRAPADLRPAGGVGQDPPWGTDFTFGEESAAPPVPVPLGHNRTKTVVREIVETVLLAVLVFLCVRASFQNFKVDGSSMFPTLENGQFLIVNKLVYSEVDMEKLSNFVPIIDASTGEKRNVFHGPERGDIVVLQDPRKPEVDLIKRVIGLPGETLEIVDGKVYINDFHLEEPYIKAIWHDNKPKILIPAGEYFVMGDNRDNSLDSRSQQVGFVPKDLVIGKAMVSYWPKSKFGLAPNEAGNISTKDGVPKLTTQRVDEARVGR